MMSSFLFAIKSDFQVRKPLYPSAMLEEMLESKNPFLASLQPAPCLLLHFLSCKFVLGLLIHTHTQIYICTHTYAQSNEDAERSQPC